MTPEVKASTAKGRDGLELPQLPYADIGFELRAREAARLPGFLGSTLRGGLARAMRRACCVSRSVRDCRECRFVHACSYAYLFETQRPPWAIRYPTMATVPHPMLIEPSGPIGPVEAGAVLRFTARLFGRAVDTWPYLVAAARSMAESGLGTSRARFDLVRATDKSGASLFEDGDMVPRSTPAVHRTAASDETVGDTVRVEFETPTRLVENERVLRRPTAGALVRSIAFRAATISYFHAGIDWDPSPFEELAAGVEEREVQVTWKALCRFSTRQGRKVPLDGFTGHMVCRAVPGIVRLLRLGEVLHAGKGTVFGLGRLVVWSRPDVGR